MPRSNYTDANKRQWVSRFNDSESTAAAFCREFKLPYASFMSWRRLYLAKPKGKPAAQSRQKTEFIELTVSPTPSAKTAAAPSLAAELALGSGILLRVYTVSDSSS